MTKRSSFGAQAERLRAARARFFETGSDAARAHRWPVSSYLAHENGQNGLREDSAKKYAKAFDVPWIWLFAGEGDDGQPAGRDARLALRVVRAMRLRAAKTLNELLIVEQQLSERVGAERRIAEPGRRRLRPRREPIAGPAATRGKALLHIRRVVFQLTQAEFAAIAGVGQVQVSRWEKGDRKPTIAAIARIRAEARRRGLDWNDAWVFEEIAA